MLRRTVVDWLRILGNIFLIYGRREGSEIPPEDHFQPVIGSDNRHGLFALRNDAYSKRAKPIRIGSHMKGIRGIEPEAVLAWVSWGKPIRSKRWRDVAIRTDAIQKQRADHRVRGSKLRRAHEVRYPKGAFDLHGKPPGKLESSESDILGSYGQPNHRSLLPDSRVYGRCGQGLLDRG